MIYVREVYQRKTTSTLKSVDKSSILGMGCLLFIVTLFQVIIVNAHSQGTILLFKEQHQSPPWRHTSFDKALIWNFFQLQYYFLQLHWSHFISRNQNVLGKQKEIYSENDFPLGRNYEKILWKHLCNSFTTDTDSRFGLSELESLTQTR